MRSIGDTAASNSCAELIQNWRQLARAPFAVCEAIQLVPDFKNNGLKGLYVSVSATSGGELHLEITQDVLNRTDINCCGRESLKGVTDAINPEREVVKRARIDR